MATTLVPVEEYLHTTYEPDAEYVDGVLVRRNVGTILHGRLQFLVAEYFYHFEKSLGIRVVTECRMSILGRYRIPDVMVLRFPHKKAYVVTDVPLVVVEILSPDDKLNEVLEKCIEYSSFGIPNIVVLDPENRRQYVYADSALQLLPAITLKMPSDLEFPVSSMFDQLSEG